MTAAKQHDVQQEVVNLILIAETLSGASSKDGKISKR
jgi:hypothetical protein